MEYSAETYEEAKNLKRIVPDTSAIIEGNIIKVIKEKELDYPEIIIPEAAVAELEHQANNNRPTGLKGLEELKNLQKLADKGILSIRITGRRPTSFEKHMAKTGEIDALIRDVASEEIAMLITSDKIQAKTAEAQGIPVTYYAQEYKGTIDLKIAKFFDDETMSVHLKENVPPMAKKGNPGNIKLVKLAEEIFTYKQLENIAEEILEKERYDPKSYLEADMDGAIVVQSRDLRISIARPPFSEALEITAVRPVAEVSLEEYELSDKLLERFRDNARGILISGSPGAGKSTFAQAVAKFYSEDLNKIVKTMESPRDLQVSDEITQYSPLEGDMEKTADILLLVRPDFTIYDELRKSYDFNIFADMRLAGVGMIGVVHATRPIDAIQRIASRVELGVIPSIVDTTIYIEDGEIKAIYETKLTVKVPTGMEEKDLSRPVIEVLDFETGELRNEIYTYGEQTIVMDVNMAKSSKKDKSTSNNKSSVDFIAEREILRKVEKIVPKSNIAVSLNSDERVTVYLNEKYIPKIIGRQGVRIAELEKEIGISMNIEPIDEVSDEKLEEIATKNSRTKRRSKKDKSKRDRKRNDKSESHDDYFNKSEDDSDSDSPDEPYYDKYELYPEITRDQLILPIGKRFIGYNFDILLEEEYLFTATVGKKGDVKINRDIELSDYIIDSIDKGFRLIAKIR